ncbi:MAG TPA: primosomal protein N' [Dehalococcoidia bacterium]|nr:primosomal protein N' [Dehalococcoidia bacterium]
MSYAEVAVNSPLAGRRTFSYSIPARLSVAAGQAVWVPFGRQVLQGIVLELSHQPQVEETRDIEGIIHPQPLLSPAQVELARWLSDHYLCPLFDAVALMLPPGFERRILTFFRAGPNFGEAGPSSLSPEQRAVLRLVEAHNRVPQSQVEKRLGKERAGRVVAQLVRSGLIERVYELEPAKVGPKFVDRWRLAVGQEQAQEAAGRLARRSRRQAVLLQLLQLGPLSPAEARLDARDLAVLRSLEQKGLACREQIEVRRDPLAGRRFAPSVAPQLTPAQEAAWVPIREALHQGKPSVFLLHGVTGSGKTELYLRALAEAVTLGKQGIVLVPEIALTPQTIARFASRFPDRVAVLHSQLSLGEQYDEWRRIQEGAFDVVIGSRSALFAPQPRLGLIVIDEEHEWTYKQETSPRYHAREVALKLAELIGAVVILGSATPEVESFYRARRGDYSLLSLPGRVGPAPDVSLPRVEIVDLKEELKAGHRGIFSRSLIEALGQALAAGEQAILFLNRRGAASIVQCRDCGFVLRCRRCHIPLTYHSAERGLICHQCNYQSRVPQSCPQCDSPRIKFLGVGTQRVEEEVARLFPSARLLRWDRDVTKGKNAHERIMERFLRREADVLIGTQMVAKGLDMPLVTLVGVVSADVGLYLPHFRAGERTFQLLCQVAGRAGRGPGRGRVIIQTYTPEHYAVQAAAGHDYAAFYERELAFRREHHLPPFARLARLVYTHPNASQCQKEALRLYRRLEQERASQGIADLDLIGPSPAFLERIRGRFRWHIILRGAEPARLVEGVPLPQGWSLDIDPVNLL